MQKKNDDKAAQYRALVKTGLIWEKLGRNGLALSNLIKAGVLNLKQPNPIDMIASEYLRGRLLARLGQESMADEVFRKCEIILETAF